MKVVIKEATLSSQEENEYIADLLLENGRIQAIGQDLPTDGAEVVFAKGKWAIPGLVDVHVHLREPGFEKKETIATGTLAAARGGVTTVCAMPNLNPVPDTVGKFQQVQQKIAQDAVVHTYQYAPITKKLKSDEIVDMAAFKQAGAFAFTNDGVGVQTADVMYQAMQQAAALHLPIVAHTEDNRLVAGGVMHEGIRNHELGLKGIPSVAESSQIARDLMLAEATGVHYHICHISTKESVRLVRDAKRAGIHVTCEVTPHHLLLNEQDITENHGHYKMNPPLRSVEDQQALIEGLLDGTIDCIATDHAPHQMSEKDCSIEEAAFGIVGIEDAFALLYTRFVQSHVFTLEQLIQWMSTRPATIFGLNGGRLAVGQPADLTIVDLDTPHIIRASDFVSKGKSSPFIGSEVYGRPVATFVSGRCVWKEQEG